MLIHFVATLWLSRAIPSLRRLLSLRKSLWRVKLPPVVDIHIAMKGRMAVG